MSNALPPFLLERPRPQPPDVKGGRVRTPFLDKGIHHIAKVIKTTYVQWETASRSGLFQGLDPRLKLMFMALFLVVISLKKEVVPELYVAALVFVLAAASRVELVSMYRRVLFFGFFFGFIIALPSALNVVREGDVVVGLVSLSTSRDFWIYHVPKDIGLTAQGLRGVALLTMRVVNSVSVTLLILYTTPFPEIIRALKVFRVPDTFLMIINLTYKYIFIFARTVEDMHLAMKSRQLGPVGGAQARGWIAGRIALIFKRTQLKCEELYTAMLSRGFTGEIRLQGFGRATGRDYAAGITLFAAGAALLFI